MRIYPKVNKSLPKVEVINEPIKEEKKIEKKIVVEEIPVSIRKKVEDILLDEENFED